MNEMKEIRVLNGNELPDYRSVSGNKIDVWCFGRGEKTVLLMGGVHGDEKGGVLMARRILRRLKKCDPSALTNRIVVMPVVNPDGYKAQTRRNARKVDINRNFLTKDFHANEKKSGGTEPLSEPETKAIIEVVDRFKPALIVTLHGFLACINYNGDSALKVAEQMSAICALEIKGDIGYPCPGSMGTYYGWERQLPVITLELPKEGADLKPIDIAVMDAIGARCLYHPQQLAAK